LLIGITGGVGSGKSKVAARLGELLCGIVISADDVCRDLLEVGREGYKQFVQSGGSHFLDKDGTIDRRKLREALFTEASLRVQLESILHPLVLEKIRNVVKNNLKTAIIAEVPLLFESGWQHEFDTILSVFSQEDCLIDRVVKRDQTTREEVRRIIAAQMSMQEKNRSADYVVDNSAAWKDTEKQLMILAAKLQKNN
jgi:dephospho-CoA kinase